ncbi:DUF2271 domain-containing protein [Owenweeksia hongkongensis]|uniref:DUF2271 domain-containing protein n=1 Tax=Owenweeksia hongkongensis TaxID=253245 RepID=UPI003A958747
MKKLRILLFALAGLMLLGAFKAGNTTSKKFKCMIQMVNYTGEGAYIIISLIDPKGAYEETLFIHGEDDEWYHEIDEWWKFWGAKKRSVDGITGETLAGGERLISVLNIDESKINAGYKLRFETSVEDEGYHVKDVEIPLTTEALKAKAEGTGFIRYVRLMPQ